MAVLQSTAPAIPFSAEISLYVGDLHQDVTDNVLQGAFSEFSSITNVRVCRDSSTGRSLGYGYINFLSQQEATRAIDEKNHFVLNGKAIRVTWCHRASDARRSGIGNVFVKNLCGSIDSMKLQQMFQNFGNVVSCKVATSDDGKSKGYGFVQFESENCANAAIEKLNGSTVGSKKIYVAKFVKKSDRVVPSSEATYTNVYIKNIDTSVSEESLQNKFSPYGKIVSLVIVKDENGASRGFGFVNFENSDDAKRAAETLHGSQLGSKVLYVARAQKKSERGEMLRRQFEEKNREQILKYQSSNVYVKNIEDDVTEDELRHYFSQCGIITSVKLMRDDKGVSKGFGFVCFSTPEEANKAVNTFHGFILRYKPLYVAIAQRKEERKAQLQIQYAQCMMGFAGPPAVIHGGFSQVYYPGPGVVPQIPAPSGMMYPPLAFRPGWRANGFANPSRISVQPSPVPMVSNNSRYQRQYRARMNRHDHQQTGGPSYTPHLQQHPTHHVAPSIESSNQQRVGHMYVPNRKPHEMKKGHPAGQPVKIAAAPGAEGSEMLTSMLSAAPLKKQKQILGEHLHPLVLQIKPDLASKITGMLLEMDNSELLLLLDSPDSLAAKVDEAVEVLKFSNAKVTNQDSHHSSYYTAGVAVN